MSKSAGKVVRVDAALLPGSETLYQLTGEYLEAQQRLLETDLDPTTIADTLEGLKGAIEVKAVKVEAMALHCESFATAIRGRMAIMEAKAKALESRTKMLRTYTLMQLTAAGFKAGDRIDSPEITLALQKNPPRVQIDDEKLIPGFYWRDPPAPPPVIDKAALLEDLKKTDEGGNPRHIPGAKLVQETRLVSK